MESAQQLGFQTSHRVALLILCLLLLTFVLELVRRAWLKERYALLWLAAAAASLVIGFFPGLISGLARLVHVQYLTIVFGLSFLFLLGIVLGFSVIISRLSEHNRELAQELALLSQRVRQFEEKHRDQQ